MDGFQVLKKINENLLCYTVSVIAVLNCIYTKLLR